MRNLEGVFYLSRSLVSPFLNENEFLGDASLFTVWIQLLGWANTEDSKRKVGRQQVMLRRGELLTSHDELGGVYKISRQTVRRCLKYLATTDKITIASSANGLHITIIDYDMHQSPSVGGVHPLKSI